jgi:predicted O-linked N-acetylglucosamine transferase (SPINDLY family)
MSPNQQQGLRLALEYQQGGRPAEAEAIYRQLLATSTHPELLHRLGLMLLKSGRHEEALPLLEQAKAMAPGNGETWLALTQCLLNLGRAKEAKKVISEAIRQGLRHPMADELLKQARSGLKARTVKAVPLGQELRQLDELLRIRRYAEAERLGKELVRRQPTAHHAWYQLGMAYLLQGKLDEALETFRRVIGLNPRFAEAQFNLGFTLQQLGRFEEALAVYQQVLALAPDLTEARNNMGFVLQRMERNEEAAEAYRAVIDRRPDLVEPRISLVTVLNVLGRYEEARQAGQEAVALQPKSFEAHAGLGFALRELGRREEAIEAYRRALALKPNDAEAHGALGSALLKAFRHEEACDAFRRSLDLAPSPERANSLAGALGDSGRHDEAMQVYREYQSRFPDSLTLHSNMLLVLNYEENMTPEALLAEAKAYGDKVSALAKAIAHHDYDPDPLRPLRVGLVSGDLGEHPVGYFLANVLASLDPREIELFVYATAERRDALNARLHRLIPNWCEATSKQVDDETLVHRIRSDGIDILIDLAGHTGKTRLPVFAWKPAPVQVAWLGYFATTGLKSMDYILADKWVLPTEEEAHFLEKPWRLPDAYYCFSSPDADLPVSDLPALRNGHVTFGCFNNPRKINDQVIACWARVLQGVPNSRLFLKYRGYEDDGLRVGIIEKMNVVGIPADRLRFEGKSSRADYLATYGQVDLALDPFPFPGGTTSVEGLWMGVPVLTLKGDRFISHQGETILQNVGLPEWIAADEDEYVAKAVAFASDLPSLAALRARLRRQLLASPLCDAPRFARNLEEALRGMWRKWCGEQGVAE